ncbi:Kinesin-like protein KIN-14S [Glycine max]|nr:Kinesin-like protein KIN-14S [Glycine max]
MDDQIIKMLTEKFNRFGINCNLKPSSESQPSVSTEACDETDNVLAQLNNETSDNMDESSIPNGIHECSPREDHTLPILKKILDLSTKIQNLKKQHVALSNQVKLTTESFPGLDVLKSVQLLGAEYEVLKRKYVEESSERRRLYNEVIELKGNIRVFCRCRPLNESEIANGSAVSVVNFESSSDELQVICSDSSKKHFKFDYVFRPEDNQETVFEQTIPIVTSVLDGYNVCIFAYGQTGTGKTFTMEGTPQHRGVNYRTLEELFRISEERNDVIKYELFVSMLEVYNEKIRDLLVENSVEPTKKLEIKQAVDGTQEVPGLIEARVYGTVDVWEKLKSGNQARSVGSTSANELSSRENLINGQKTRSHLWLVDLAGSERVGKTEAEGERLKESQFINKSLSALGDVISALASKSAHIPYRNSKLTHILQSSLGGDCKTLMFVQISPGAADLTETLCSLNFATRVRGIESGPARKQTDLTELNKYKQMVRDLENQVTEERKMRLKQESKSLAAVSAQPSTMSESIAARKIMKKPPLDPRLPLRRITNILPPPPERKPSCSSSMDEQENIARTTSINTQDLVKPRRGVSIAVRPPTTPSTSRTLQPRRRRVSVATLCPVRTPLRSPTQQSPRRPSCSSSMDGQENIARTTSINTQDLMKPRRRVSIAVRPPPPPSASQALQPRRRRVSVATLCPVRTPLGFPTQQSPKRNQRETQYSRLFAPLPEAITSVETASPTLMRSSSKFAGSPRHQRRKPLVWTPLKLKGLKNSSRKSLVIPSRPFY